MGQLAISTRPENCFGPGLRKRTHEICAARLSGFAVAIIVGPAFAADPQMKTIILPQVEARSGASDKYYATCTLHFGDPVDVVGAENGWLKIKPPIDSFDWVNAGDVEVLGTTANVVKKTHLRRGSALEPH